MKTLTTKKSRIGADNLNYYSAINIEGTTKRLTRGMIDGKRVYFLETIIGGHMEASETFTSFSKMIKGV